MKPDAFADAVVTLVKRALAGPQAHLQSLEQRVTDLEARDRRVKAGLAYCGTWQRAMTYTRDQGTTHKSQLWIVVSDTTRDEPGTSGAWQLADKNEGAR